VNILLRGVGVPALLAHGDLTGLSEARLVSPGSTRFTLVTFNVIAAVA
jgi:hypothetical protein